MPQGIPIMNSAAINMDMLWANTARKIVPIIKTIPPRKVLREPIHSWKVPVTRSPTNWPQVVIWPRSA